VPFNGAGMFVRLRNWVEDAAAGVKIRADYHDVEDDNFATGISQCIARDGQSTITGNIPMNSKRIVALSDPVDPQDGSTKAYTDTKLPLAGGTIAGNLDVTGNVSALGYKTRQGLPGPAGTNFFNFDYTGGNVEAWIDTTKIGALATRAFTTTTANDAAAAAAAPKVNRAGDTITGSLTVNGELVARAAYLRFQSSGGPGYILWSGGGSYSLGGGGAIWHTGNLNPIQDARLLNAGGGTSNYNSPNGAVITALAVATGTYAGLVNGAYFRYLQLLTPGGWYTVGHVG
jgi:hypothetical protein